MLKLLFLSLLYLNVSFADSKDIYDFNSLAEQKIFSNLTHELRCLVCQNQAIYDSRAPLAQDLRYEIYLQLKQGKNEKEILHYLTARYGDFILYTPPLKTYTYFLWFLPGIFLIVGGGILFFLIRSKKQEPS